MPFPFIPLRRSTLKMAPLPVVMSGVRAGERVLQIGIDNPAIAQAIAAKPGMNGRAAFVVADDRTATLARRAATEAMTVPEVEVTASECLPFEDAAFDLVVLHARTGAFSTLDGERLQRLLRDAYRTLRGGGRIVVMASGTPVGLKAMLRPARPTPPAQVGDALQQAGYRPVRTLADREGYLFTEGLRPQT
jgi:SAM-dependent methyltransferase